MELTIPNFIIVALLILIIAAIFGIVIGLLLIWLMGEDDDTNKHLWLFIPTF